MDLNTALDLLAKQSNTINQLVNDLKVERERNAWLQDMLSPNARTSDYTRTEPKLSEQREMRENVEVGG